MNRIPVDTPALGDTRFLSSEPKLDGDGNAVIRDKVPVQVVSVLIKPLTGKREVIEVNVPSKEPPRGQEYAKIRLMNLTARPWAVDGRNGITFNADEVNILPLPQGDAK